MRLSASMFRFFTSRVTWSITCRVFELGLAARKGSFEHEGWRRRKDGSRFYVHEVINALFTPQGELYGYIKLVRDLRRPEEGTGRDYRPSALDDF